MSPERFTAMGVEVVAAAPARTSSRTCAVRPLGPDVQPLSRRERARARQHRTDAARGGLAALLARARRRARGGAADGRPRRSDVRLLGRGLDDAPADRPAARA